MTRSASGFVAALVIAVSAGPALAQNLVQNPSFEQVSSGTINGATGLPNVPNGWSQTGSLDCVFQALQTGDQPSEGSDFTIGTGGASNPSDGARVLISDEGPANVSCKIFQDVAIPAGAKNVSLVLDAGFVFIDNATPGSSVSVDVTTPGGALLANVYTHDDTLGNDPLTTQPAVDLTAFAGQTVRIVATVTVPDSNWTGLMLDNVRLTGVGLFAVPTLSQWSLVLLGAFLGIAAWVTRRRMRN